jgi:hypothetical protein
MKLVILFLFILLTVISCGGKKETGKASFRLLLGGSIAAQVTNQFPGGLLLMGRRIEGGQSFKLRFTEGLSLDLLKGNWEFATIGWFEAGYNGHMQGNQKCSYRQVELKEDNQSIAFEMSKDSCLTLTSSQGEKFADSQFLNLSNGSSTFRTLKINTCQSLDSSQCNQHTGLVKSVRITIPAELEGISVGVGTDGLSECINIANGYGEKYLTLPLGGSSGFIKTHITKFDDSNCLSGTSIETLVYPDGLGGRADFKSKLSPANSVTSAGVIFKYKGIWGDISAFPAPGSNGDTYKLAVDINLQGYPAYPGDFIVFRNGNWESVLESNEMSVSADGKIYFSSYMAYLFLLDTAY